MHGWWADWKYLVLLDSQGAGTERTLSVVELTNPRCRELTKDHAGTTISRSDTGVSHIRGARLVAFGIVPLEGLGANCPCMRAQEFDLLNISSWRIRSFRHQ